MYVLACISKSTACLDLGKDERYMEFGVSWGAWMSSAKAWEHCHVEGPKCWPEEHGIHPVSNCS